MKNKILSLVLALLMAASSASAVLADDVVAISEEPEVIEAVEETVAGEYDKAIEFLANYGIFKGYSADDTGAEDLIERYQMALFVSRIATGWTNDEVWENGKDQWTNFSDIDVDPVNKYFGALSFAAQNKIIEGYGDGKFGPQDNINYQNALTMVVRTLGYTGLEWPWGYIQKAVELGLTDGISGVAYTDDLTRGEVAQIIYNAMFAKMKDGSNLALKNFGIEFGWEKVVITASNDNTFVKLATDKGTGVEKQFIEFKLLNDDGSLGDDTYKALAADFDLDYEAHEDDLAVGRAYYVLFEKDADSELAEIVAVEDLYVETLENTGKLNDYEIKEFFEANTLVTKYTANNYLNSTASLKNEVMVWDKVGGITVEEIDGYNIAIDWATGNILSIELDNKNNPVDKNKDGKITKDDYTVAWTRATYGDESGNERYYKVKYDKKGETVLGIDWMTEEEFEEFYASTARKSNHNYKGFTALESIANTAYASLELFDTNLDGAADRGLYETYALGYFDNTTKKCDSCGKEYEYWKFADVGTFEKAAKAAKVIDEKAVFEGAIDYAAYPDATCDHNKAGAYFVDGYTPLVDEEGEYVDGYVIYGVDKEIGAVKVVKTIAGTEDEDNYVTTGILRAYNVNKKTVTIGEDKLSIDYNELIGNGFYQLTEKNGIKDIYDEYLKSLFNQFVKYVVVDGELVHIEAAGKPSKTELIVVDGYKGISADGYIVVEGYSTTDLEYAEFRLGSVDGWKKGDAFYNEEKYDFDRGVVYNVVSYDKDEDAYFVETISDGNGRFAVEGYEDSYVKITTGDEDTYDSYFTKVAYDYAKKTWGTSESYTKMTTDDKWIFVGDTNGGEYAVIDVFTGKLPEEAVITGDLVYGKDNVYLVVNANVNFKLDMYGAGVVVLYKDSFDLADYNGEYAEDDRYILGGVDYVARVFNVLTGEDNVTVGAFNRDFEIGYTYHTEAGILNGWYRDPAYTSASIVNMINATFTEDTYVAKYIPNIFNADGSYITIGKDKNKAAVTFDKLYDKDDDNTHKKAVEAMILNDLGEIDGSSKYLNKIEDVTYRVIEIDEVGTRKPVTKIVDINDDIKGDKDAETFTKWMAKEGKDYSDLTAFYVYNVAARKIVIYIVLNDAENVETTTETVTLKDNENVSGKKIIVDTKADKKTNVVAEVIVDKTLDDKVFTGEYTVTDMTFAITADELDHLEEGFKYHYGKVTTSGDKETWNNVFAGDVCEENATAKVTIFDYTKTGKDVVTEDKAATVTWVSTYDDNCDLVNKIKVTLSKKVVLTNEAEILVELDFVDGVTEEAYALKFSRNTDTNTIIASATTPKNIKG